MKGSKFLDHVREVIRTNHFSYSTEKTYIIWLYRFIIFHNKEHPKDMGTKEISEFLTYLAVERKVSASTQNQALNALAFVYKKVLKITLDDFDFKHAKIGKRLPVVFSRDEIIIRGGKGNNDRRTLLSRLLIPQLKRQIEKSKIKLEENMLVKEFKGTSISEALERKYPNASKELAWKYISPSRKPAIDPRSGKLKQHCRHESFLQKTVKNAIRNAEITKIVRLYNTALIDTPRAAT
ncbi:MAG: phage integrase N-terminal SAM-like domain-containing protein [Bacteroidetes bacterium]|nr:phage integrase N-terminal SAM-like domain-containing protein [Bacteroidota bacterium]